jgi:hypothetical protein
VALILLAAGALLATQAPAAGAAVPRLVFPVVADVSYQDDFGDPRGQGSHEGNDLMAPWKAPAVAVEGGTVRIYTRSARAGCMLYLYGGSGTTYLYIHLNNDLTADNDNEGGCKRGVAYAPGLRDGQRVRAGQLIGYVGDSGDADGIAHHLHFEVHPDDGAAVSPYPYLRRAERLLFALASQDPARGPASPVALTLVGTVVSYEGEPPAPGEPAPPASGGESPPPEDGSGGGSGGGGSGGSGSAPPPPPPPPVLARTSGDDPAGEPLARLTIRVTRVRLSTGELWTVTRRVVLSVPDGAVLERASGASVGWEDLLEGLRVSVTTSAVEPTLAAQRARPGVLQAARVLVRR